MTTDLIMRVNVNTSTQHQATGTIQKAPQRGFIALVHLSAPQLPNPKSCWHTINTDRRTPTDGNIRTGSVTT